MNPQSAAAPAEAAAARPILLLCGRPNTGKTTLFNALTGLRQRVANFAGCTVERAEGVVTAGGRELDLVDLPGTFSIIPSTEDELVALRFLKEAAGYGRPFRAFCVAEASNLQNDLTLAVSLKDCGYPVSLVVNMIDEAEKNGLAIDASKLSTALGMPVYLTAARSGRGLDALKAAMASSPRSVDAGHALDFQKAEEHALKTVHKSALRAAQAAARAAVSQARSGRLRTVSESISIDRWLFHPVAGPLILALAMFGVFEALFALGGPLGDGITAFLSAGSSALRPLIPTELLSSLVCDGVIAGIAAVAAFLPQIAILFILIGFLEQSGYLPRAGAMVDRALRPFGLDGKVFIPFLSSFACAIPGVMATRTIPNEKRRLAATLLCPLMTCSARIPVYTLIIAAFVPATFRVWRFNGQGVVMAGMYAFGIATALALALVLRATPLYETCPSPVTILPPYRFPKVKELARYAWIRCWHFLSKAGTIIFSVSVLLWALGSFPKDEAAVAPLQAQIAAAQAGHPGADVSALEGKIAAANLEHSLLGRIGHGIEPVFRPIGYDWRLSVAILSSLAAREVFVGTLGTIFALGSGNAHAQGLVEALRAARAPDGSALYSVATAVSLLIFFAIALQCVSTIVIVRRETGSWKWPALQFAVFFVLAYSLSWAGYHLTVHLLGV